LAGPGLAPIDQNSGNQGGITEGLFEFWWKGETLYARNNAVGDSYLFGWSNWPEEATREGPGGARQRALIWRPIITPMAASCFIRCTVRVLSCRWHWRGTM
jgi:ureidoglycolate lyase